MRTIHYDFGPLTWTTRRAYIHDVDFDELTTLEPDEVVLLRGEDGTTYRASVVSVETGRLGRTWTLHVDADPQVDGTENLRLRTLSAPARAHAEAVMARTREMLLARARPTAE
jgi:hypothetical protein